MNILPASETVRSQRDVELDLLHFLKEYNPEVYAVWGGHPEMLTRRSAGGGDEDTEVVAANPSPKHLLRRVHREYVLTKLGTLPGTMQSLYPQRPFVCYWALQTADVLGLMPQLLEKIPSSAIAELLHSCLAQAESSDALDDEEAERSALIGFAGGPSSQIPHVIPSLAACSALTLLSDPQYLQSLPRAAIKRWLLSLRREDGGFPVHHGGETDVRGSYCVSVIVTLLCLDDPMTWGVEEPLRNEAVLNTQTAKFVSACQTHEGGFSCQPRGSEAHGAFTYCGLGALLLMRQPQLGHTRSLRRWLAMRQLAYEGGFNGRTNKLVDSCYSHWVGSAHVLLHTVESYKKLYGTGTAAWLPRTQKSFNGVEGEEGVEDALPMPCMLAKEVLLLDHAQLLDVSGISCSDNAAWDAEEKKNRLELDVLEKFLATPDCSLLEASQRQQRKERLLRAVSEARQMSGDAFTEPCPAPSHAFTNADVGDYYFNQRKLQQYVFRCCQDVEDGGLRDKPGCPNDLYHSCYSLSGVSASQNLQYLLHVQSSSPYVKRAFEKGYVPNGKSFGVNREGKQVEAGSYGVVVGVEGPSPEADACILRSCNPILNINRSRVVSALNAFGLKSFI